MKNTSAKFFIYDKNTHLALHEKSVLCFVRILISKAPCCLKSNTIDFYLDFMF